MDSLPPLFFVRLIQLELDVQVLLYQFTYSNMIAIVCNVDEFIQKLSFGCGFTFFASRLIQAEKCLKLENYFGHYPPLDGICVYSNCIR